MPLYQTCGYTGDENGRVIRCQDGYAVEVFRLEEGRAQVMPSYAMISRCNVRNKCIRRCVVFGLVKASPKFSTDITSSKTYPAYMGGCRWNDVLTSRQRRSAVVFGTSQRFSNTSFTTRLVRWEPSESVQRLVIKLMRLRPFVVIQKGCVKPVCLFPGSNRKPPPEFAVRTTAVIYAWNNNGAATAKNHTHIYRVPVTVLTANTIKYIYIYICVL